MGRGEGASAGEMEGADGGTDSVWAGGFREASFARQGNANVGGLEAAAEEAGGDEVSHGTDGGGIEGGGLDGPGGETGEGVEFGLSKEEEDGRDAEGFGELLNGGEFRVADSGFELGDGGAGYTGRGREGLLCEVRSRSSD